MHKLIDGKAVAKQLQEELRLKVESIQGRKPCLAVVLVGTHAPSEIYVSRKVKACEEAGICSIKLQLPTQTSQEELLKKIKELNEDPAVDGILVQLPLPPHINPNVVTEYISPHKDVDGFHPSNVGKLLIGQKDGFVPCTPLGIKTLMEHYKIETQGKHVVILGRSNIVGKPIASLLMQNTAPGNATVSILNSHSVDLKPFCRIADILISAIGKPNFVTADMVKDGAVVIDVGINMVKDETRASGYRIVGDVDFDAVAPKTSMITPVPGGVGPMTIAMLLHNTVRSYEKSHS